MAHTDDIRKILNEARRIDDPDVDYEEEGGTKKNPNPTKVIAVLKSHTSGSATRLAQKYAEIDQLQKQLADLRAGENERIKSTLDDYFDAEDETMTRVIRSMSFVMTFSKVTHKPESEKSDTDFEAVVNELLEVVPTLETVLKELIDKHTKITKVPPKTTPTRLKVEPVELGKGGYKAPTKESITEDSIESWHDRFFDLIDSVLLDIDDKLNDIEDKYDI